MSTQPHFDGKTYQPSLDFTEFFYTFPKGWDEARLRDMQAQGGVQ